MKRIAIIFLFILFQVTLLSSVIVAQEIKLPQKKYRDKATLSEIMNKQKRLNGFSIAYGYHQSSFLNPVFSENRQKNMIERKYGGVLMTRFTVHPIIIDLDWFSSRFRVHDQISWPYQDTTNVRHRGVSIFVSSTLFPLIHSQGFIPYIGVGYQSSSLGVNINLINFNGRKDKIKTSSIDTSSPVWKVGTSIALFAAYKLTVEYRQSLFLDEKKAFNELGVLLGIDYSRIK